MISSFASCTAEFVIEHVSEGSDSILGISMCSLKLSCLCEFGGVEFVGSLVPPDRCLFLPSLCACPIPLALVDEQWYFVADFEIMMLKNIC